MTAERPKVIAEMISKYLRLLVEHLRNYILSLTKLMNVRDTSGHLQMCTLCTS
jgi:hypothetical protein